MPKLRNRVERLDGAISETEIAITTRVLSIVHAETEGHGTKTDRTSLHALYEVLIECHRAREHLIEAERGAEKPGGG